MKDYLNELVEQSQNLGLYEKEYHSFIHDVEELKYFYDNILQPLEKNEIYFLSLSARNKYLSTEEREELGLGRTEMFERTIIRERTWEKFLKKVRSYERNKESFLTKKGFAIPSKCITIYFNVNPSNVLKAYNEFSKTMNDYFMELGMNASKGGDIDNISDRIKKMDVLLMNCFQKNAGTKHYIDIDFDIPKTEIRIVELFLNDVKSRNPETKYFVIDTKSGFHVLLERNSIRYNFNESIGKAMQYAVDLGLDEKDDHFEIVNNKNLMIPLPGTLQGGYPVRVIR